MSLVDKVLVDIELLLEDERADLAAKILAQLSSGYRLGVVQDVLTSEERDSFAEAWKQRS